MTEESVAEIKFIIQLRSKYTGDTIHLGSSYKTKEEAKHFAETRICNRCNYYDIYSVPNDFVYGGKQIGFKPIELVRAIKA